MSELPMSANSDEEQDLMARWTIVMRVAWEDPNWPATSLRFLGEHLIRFETVGDFIRNNCEAIDEQNCFDDLHEELRRAVRHQDMNGKYDQLWSRQDASLKVCTAGDAILTFCLGQVGSWSLRAWAFQQQVPP